MAQPRTIPNLTGQTIGTYTIFEELTLMGHRHYRCECIHCGKVINKSADTLYKKPNISCNCQKRATLVGRVFGLYTVLRQVLVPTTKPSSSHVRWECKCICGKLTLLNTGHLTGGGVNSCGCVNKVDLTGNIYGKLTVIAKLGYLKGKTLYKCQCNCGKLLDLPHIALTSGNTKSCGCSKSELISLALGGTGIPYEKVESVNEFIRYSSEYAAWRLACLRRDDYTCQISRRRGGNLNVHHIVALNTIIAENSIDQGNYLEYVSLLFDLDNGITLSEEIHEAFHAQYINGNNTPEQLQIFMENYSG